MSSYPGQSAPNQYGIFLWVRILVLSILIGSKIEQTALNQDIIKLNYAEDFLFRIGPRCFNTVLAEGGEWRI